MATVNEFTEAAGKSRNAVVVGFPEMLKAYLPSIERALPRHLSAPRMASIALEAFRRNPDLQKCDPRSVFACVIKSAQLGLEPNVLGRSYLIPYFNSKKGVYECTFVPGWKGLVDLQNRSGLGTVYTGVIYEDQRYTYEDGSNRKLVIHNETEFDSPDKITHVYAIGWIKGAAMPIIELWRLAKVMKHLDRYNKQGKMHYAYGNMEMYARKVVLLQVLKYMPSSAEITAAIALNDAAEIGEQNINIKDVLEGDFMEPSAVEQPPSLHDVINEIKGCENLRELYLAEPEIDRLRDEDERESARSIYIEMLEKLGKPINNE